MISNGSGSYQSFSELDCEYRLFSLEKEGEFRMNENSLLDVKEHELEEDRKCATLNQIIDFDYRGNVETFIDEILQHRIRNEFGYYGGNKWQEEL
jgi:hypothetical protein